MTTANSPTRLLVEHLVSPIGTSTQAPRLSWWLPEGAQRQAAYRLRSTNWDSGWVTSPAHTLVPYTGPIPGSRERIEWQVQVRTDLGASDWSAPSSWEVGLLGPEDWAARWISPADTRPHPGGERPAHLLSRTFDLDAPVQSARIYATAHGLYELFLNGQRVGDLELTPGWTDYRHQLDVQTYDVTDLVRPGGNDVVAVLSDGWWRGQIGFTREVDCYGPRTALLAQIEIHHPDGTSNISTDDSWQCAPSQTVRADLIGGQTVDLRHEPHEWTPAEVVDVEPPALTTSPAPPTRRIEHLRPVSVARLVSGNQVVDLGQNINGWICLTDLGPAGTTTRLEHGEMLALDGEVHLAHLATSDYFTKEVLSPGQVDEVTSGGTDDAFEPRHTTHGFQYVSIQGRDDDLMVDDLTGVVVHTDLTRTGWFASSDERLDRLHEAAVWSFRDNACEIPTDCPQRERVGWTGDWQLFCPTAAFLYDVAGFSAKWLRDLRSGQWADGRVPNYVPDPYGPASHDEGPAGFLTGSAGWGDATTIVPWEMWAEYGDERFLSENYTAMVAWVDFAARRAHEGRHASRVARRPDPAPHETHLWDTGFHWGEWCEPDGIPEGTFTLEEDMAAVATAFLFRSASLVQRAATILGNTVDANQFGELADAVRSAWQLEFIDADGRVQPGRQANLVRALAFDLVPDELRQDVADQLATLVHEAGDHLGTGFLATPFLLPVLADHGHLDLAYTLLLQDTPPSWLAMIDQGATTIWENWNRVDDDGFGSLNHYSKGAVVSFLHRHVAGLRPDDRHPGYERFVVAPQPGGGLTHAEAVHDARLGRVRSTWSITDGNFDLEVQVPPGARADVTLPDGRREAAGPGTSTWTTPFTTSP